MSISGRNDWLTAYHVAAIVGVASVAIAGTLASTGICHAAPWPIVWPDEACVTWLCLLPVVASTWCIIRNGIRDHLAVLIVSLLVLLCLPAFYTQVRIANLARVAQEMVEESRFGEAQSLLKQIVQVRPSATWRGVDLGQASTRLEALIEPIAKRAREPLPSTADSDQRLTRARDLAMLGRTGEALQVLATAPAFGENPDALVLRGAIYEASRHWQAARDCYARAISLLPDESAETFSTILHTYAKALAGLGHCQRKLGHLPEAEAAYTKLLEAAPTAETHFLVAQFYEDTQQAALAAAHARRAAELSPNEFQQRAWQLEARLTTSHFGCLSAFWNRPTANQGVRDAFPKQ